jgi:hypothetical protein
MTDTNNQWQQGHVKVRPGGAGAASTGNAGAPSTGDGWQSGHTKVPSGGPFADERMTGSLGDAARAVGEGAAGGFVRNAPVLPAMVAGATIGGASFGLPGAVIGGLGVGAYSMYAANKAASGLGLRTPEEMDPETRKFAYWGESFGGSMGALSGPAAVARTSYRLGDSAAGKLLNRMLDTIKETPLRFAAAETAMASSAATAAMSSEHFAPGSDAWRVNAEFAGGLLNPAQLVTTAASFTGRSVMKVYQAISPEGRMTAAAKLVKHAHDIAGDDVASVYAAYKAAGVIDPTNPDPIQGSAVKGLQNMNPAQLTGGKGMTALISHLEDGSKQFGAENAERLSQGLDVMRGHMSLLTLTGDPEAVKAAATIRNDYYRTLNQGMVDMALNKARVAATGITTDTPKARLKLSSVVKDELDTAIVASRKVEKEKWTRWIAAENDGPSGFTNLERQFKDEYDNVPKEYRPEIVPAPIAEFLKRIKSQGKPIEELVYDPETLSFKTITKESPGTTVGEMYRFRSIFLDKARSLANAGDHGSARAYNNLAEAVLDDLDAAMTPAGKAAYDDARGFTREFHDAFTRSFVGKTEATGKYGDRIAPELTLTKALAAGKEAGAVQLGEIEHATRFLLDRKLADGNSVALVMDAQERFLRLAAADALDPETGKLNASRLSKFIYDNDALMERFPGVKDDLNNAVKTTREVQRLELMVKGQNRLMEDTKVFSKIVKNDGVIVAQNALLSHNMQGDLEKIITGVTRGTVGKGGVPLYDVAAATAGLRASVYTAALHLSRGSNKGPVNLQVMRSLIYDPPPGQKSAMQVMLDTGVVSAREAGKIKTLFDTLDAIQRSTKPGTAIEVKPDLTDSGLAVLSRVAGSGVMGNLSQVSPMGSGHGLIVASAGARLGEFIFTKLGAQTARTMLIDAISDPSSGKLDLIMQQASRMTPQQVQKQATQLNAYRIQVGVGSANDWLRDDEDYTGPGTKRDIK